LLSSDHPAQPSGSQPGIPIIKSIWQVTRIRGKTAKHPEWGLSFYNIHTGDDETVEYCLSGCLISPSLKRINHILRDHRTGEMKDIDVRLLGLLHALSRKTSTDVPFHVISGYRSPRTNAALRESSGGVAASVFRRALTLASRAPLTSLGPGKYQGGHRSRRSCHAGNKRVPRFRPDRSSPQGRPGPARPEGAAFPLWAA